MNWTVFQNLISATSFYSSNPVCFLCSTYRLFAFSEWPKTISNIYCVGGTLTCCFSDQEAIL